MLFRNSVVPAFVLLLASLATSCGGTTTAPSPQPPITPQNTFVPPTPGAKAEYTLTFTASPSCSFPPGIEKRTYTATVQEWILVGGGSRLDVSIDDAEMMQGYGFFSGTRTGDTVVFDISYDYGYGVIEMIDQTRPLFFEGDAQARIGERNISGTFRGRMALFDSLSTFKIYDRAPDDCQATDHKIEFVER